MTSSTDLDLQSEEYISKLYTEISKSNRRSLSKAITLVESNNIKKKKLGRNLVQKILDDNQANSTPKTIRIGISGPPGTGKSTFIEALGTYLLEKGNKVAVLAIDPSSILNKGSILGDKTRMEKLSRSDNAYIRPSPTSNVLGGVATATRESILICEAAGYNVILIETVGVGQSEFLVKSMCDYFLLLSQPGSGDDLQGIKKGIIEISDFIAVTKDDGTNRSLVKESVRFLKNAISLSHNSIKFITSVSSYNNTGLSELWEQIAKSYRLEYDNGLIKSQREQQIRNWIDTLSKEILLSYIQKEYDDTKESVINKYSKSPYKAAELLASNYIAGIYENFNRK